MPSGKSQIETRAQRRETQSRTQTLRRAAQNTATKHRREQNCVSHTWNGWLMLIMLFKTMTNCDTKPCYFVVETIDKRSNNDDLTHINYSFRFACCRMIKLT